VIRDFGRFWWDFVVGDDWWIAAGVLLALGATYGLTRIGGLPAWWLLPLAAVAVLAHSVWRRRV
jgi:hypothetical protein